MCFLHCKHLAKLTLGSDHATLQEVNNKVFEWVLGTSKGFKLGGVGCRGLGSAGRGLGLGLFGVPQKPQKEVRHTCEDFGRSPIPGSYQVSSEFKEPCYADKKSQQSGGM